MKKRKDVVFFCQAGADIVHILKEVDEIKKEDLLKKIRIVTLGIPLYICFKRISLPDKVSVCYIRRLNPPLKRPWKKKNWERIVDKLLLNNVLGTDVENVYFTSVNDDPVASYYVVWCLKQGCKICYLNHYDDIQAIAPTNEVSLYDRIRLLIYNYITGLKYSWYRMGGRWNVIHFNYKTYPISELHPLLDKGICQKYSYKLSSQLQNAILVFSQPNREQAIISDDEYNKMFNYLVKLLKENGFYVVIKGHPVLGICPSNKEQADEEIPQILPSELIDYDVFCASIGFITIALSSAAKLGLPSYSIISLMKQTSSKNYKECVESLMTSSDNKINFLKSWNEIASLKK